ncbi:MAG: 50S ribosomal protein L10 [Acidobacteriota bacterium]
MKLTKEQKKQKSKTFAVELQESPAVYFTEFQGLRFINISDLRARLRPHDVRYRVVKNAVAKHALMGAGVSGDLDSLFKGPVGMVFGKGKDPVAAVKVLAAFGREFPKLKIKAGYLDSRWYTSDQCVALSKLGSRQELLGQLAGVLQQPICQIASVLQAPMRDLALVLKALEKKQATIPA